MNTITLHLRRFPVEVKAQDTGEESTCYLTLEKSQLQAAQICGQSCKELITRMIVRQGYGVLGIGKPVKQTVTLNLDKLWRDAEEHREAEAREKWLLLHSHERRGEAD